MDENDIDLQNSEEEPIQHEQFTNLTYISIDVLSYNWHDSDEKMAQALEKKKRLIEKLKKFLVFKFPNLKHPIQVDNESHDDCYIRFESRPVEHS